MLYCLNLSPHLRYEPENVYVAGLTPPPSMPGTTTISHLLDPVVTAMTKYGTPEGEQVPTYGHPEGVTVQAKAAPLVADLEASRKVSGFLGHAANLFCSFCLCNHAEIEELDLGDWDERDCELVRQQAEAWLNEPTKAHRAILQTANGVRWTSLFRLNYWDPTKHVVLGYMHNWLEGILQHHLRNLWGIGREAMDKQRLKDLSAEEQWTDTDISDSADELSDLLEEQLEYQQGTSSDMQHLLSPNFPSLSQSSGTTAPQSPTPSSTPTPSHNHSQHTENDDNSETNNHDSDYFPPEESTFNFSEDNLVAIRNCIANVTLPTWVQRPPTNLGDPGHGRLKAQEFLILFTCIFPLVIPELWYTPTSPELLRQHFTSFYHLVTATNIISSFKTSNAAADDFHQHYIQYRTTLQHLFPNHSSKPNHHYAMHNASLMKYWGPLPSFSEFPGERLNGMFQQINTNRRLSMSFLGYQIFDFHIYTYF